MSCLSRFLWRIPHYVHKLEWCNVLDFSLREIWVHFSHYLVQSQNYKVSVGGSLSKALLWQNLIGDGVTAELPHYTMPGLLCSTPHQMPEIQQRCPHLGIYRRKRGKTTKLLSSLFFSSFFFVAFAYLLHFLFCVWGHRSSFVGALMDFLRLYLVPTLSFLSLGTVSGRSQSGVMSTSGRLSGWFMNLAALPIGLGFRFQSSEGVWA